MGEVIAAYIAGLLTIPVLAALWILLSWAFGKTTGTDGCVTECSGARELEIGEHYNITVLLDRIVHRLFWSTRPSHKAAVTKYWQDIYDAGGQTRTDVGVVFRD